MKVITVSIRVHFIVKNHFKEKLILCFLLNFASEGVPEVENEDR